MSFKDEELTQFFRRNMGGRIKKIDIELSEDVYCLQPIIYYLAYSIKAKTLVEIGTADGSTAFPMMKVAEENGGICHSVDPSKEGTRRAVELAKEFGYYNKYWKLHLMKSDDFFKGFDKEIDFAFIDGDHDCISVAKDVRNCCERLSYHGLILVSDFNMCEDDPECNCPEIYLTEKDPSMRASCGIYKGLRCVMEDFPYLDCILLHTRDNPSVLIGKRYSIKRKYVCNRREVFDYKSRKYHQIVSGF